MPQEVLAPGLPSLTAQPLQVHIEVNEMIEGPVFVVDHCREVADQGVQVPQACEGVHLSRFPLLLPPVAGAEEPDGQDGQQEGGQDSQAHGQGQESGPRTGLDRLCCLQQQAGPGLLADLCQKGRKLLPEVLRSHLGAEEAVGGRRPLLLCCQNGQELPLRMGKLLPRPAAGEQVHLLLPGQVLPMILRSGLVIPDLPAGFLRKAAQQLREHALVALRTGVIVFQGIPVRVPRHVDQTIRHGQTTCGSVSGAPPSSSPGPGTSGTSWASALRSSSFPCTAPVRLSSSSSRVRTVCRRRSSSP